MFTTGARAFVFAAVACGGMLAACDDSPQPANSPVPTTKQGTAPKPAGLAPEMVAAVSAGKTASMFGVHFALRAAPMVNQALPVDIVMVPHQDFTAVSAHFESRDGLVLISGDVFGPFSDASSEKVLKHQLVLMPAKDGVFMVTAIIETEGAEGTVTRIFSIPVMVAPAAMPLAVAPHVNPAAASDGIAPAAK
jgi:hypothetical protein